MLTKDHLTEIEINMNSGKMPSPSVVYELLNNIRELKATQSHSSISRRDYFAGIAMEHVIPKVDSLKLSPERFLEGVVLASIKIADAMIAELDKERK